MPVSGRVRTLADLAWRAALAANAHLRDGLNVAAGKVTYAEVAKALNLDYTPAQVVLG